MMLVYHVDSSHSVIRSQKNILPKGGYFNKTSISYLEQNVAHSEPELPQLMQTELALHL